MGSIGVGEIVVIAAVVLLLFGGKKIPEVMRNIGKGVSSFRAGVNDIQNEIEKDIKEPLEDSVKGDSSSSSETGGFNHTEE